MQSAPRQNPAFQSLEKTHTRLPNLPHHWRSRSVTQLTCSPTHNTTRPDPQCWIEGLRAVALIVHVILLADRHERTTQQFPTPRETVGGQHSQLRAVLSRSRTEKREVRWYCPCAPASQSKIPEQTSLHTRCIPARPTRRKFPQTYMIGTGPT